MADVNLSLPTAMKDWIEGQTQSGRYTDAGDYIRDLIRQDQIRRGKIEDMQRLVDEALESGVSDESMADILRAMQDAAE